MTGTEGYTPEKEAVEEHTAETQASEEHTSEKEAAEEDTLFTEAAEEDTPFTEAAEEEKPETGTMSPGEQEAVVEAVLFAMGRSVDAEELSQALQCSRNEAAAAAERLRKRYEEEHRGMAVLKLEDRWQMGTKKEYYEALIRVAKAPKKQVLSQVALETLSIIAYKQPVTKAEITKIRGVSSDFAVNRLIEYGLVYEAGRLDAPGRPALFATTEEFLRRFGVDSRQDLPDVTPDQEAEIEDEVQKEMNYRFGTETKNDA